MARNSILLKLTGDGTEAKDTIRDVAAEGDKFGKRSWEARIRVDAAEAKRDIAEVIAEAKAIPREETIRIRVAGEQAKLQALQARMEGLQKALTDAAASGGATDRIVTQMGSVGRQIDSTRTRIEQLGHDFDSFGSRAFNDVKRIDGGITGLLGHIPLVGGLMSGVFSGVSNALNGIVSKLPEAVQGFVGLLSTGLSLAAVVPVLLLVVGAVAALVVSLAQALIGVVALGVAFLAALAPIAIILAAVVVKLKDAYQAQQNLLQATNAQKQAVIALHQAQQNESNQRIAALQAEKDAVLQLHDAQNGLADAKLGVRSAVLGISQAKLALKQFDRQLAGFGTSPSALDKASQDVSVGGALGQTQQGASSLSWQQMLIQRKQLVLNVAQAEQQYRDQIAGAADAQNTLAKAEQTEAQFRKKGLLGDPSYASAVAQTATATLALANANHTLNLDTRKMAASDGILGIFDKLKHTLGVLIGPAVSAAFKGLGKAFEILAKGLAPLKGSLTGLGQALGNGFVQWAKALTQPSTIAGLKTLITGAAHLVGPLVRMIDGFWKVLLDVANVAMPHLTNGVKGLGDKFASAAKHPEKIKAFIDKCIHSTHQWIDALGKIIGVFEGIAKAIAPVLSAVGTIVGAVQSIGGGLGSLVYGGHSFQDIKNIAAAGALDAAMEKSLQTGIEQYGPHMGRRLTAAMEKQILASLSSLGVHYSGRIAPVASTASTTIHQEYNVHGSHDPHHEAAVIMRRTRSLGGGVH